MSIRIEPTRLSESLVGREFVYLVTSGGERAHVVALRYVVDRDRVTLNGAGRSTHQNLASNPRITLVWPPVASRTDRGDHTVVADGMATATDDVVEVVVTNAVFHRPAP